MRRGSARGRSLGGAKSDRAWPGRATPPAPATGGARGLRHSAMSAVSADVSGTESGSESGPESGPEPGPKPGPEPGPKPGPGPEQKKELRQGSEPSQLCPEHCEPLSWFCLSERRPVCASCAGFGGHCHRHRIRRAEEHAEELRVSGPGTRVALLGRGNWPGPGAPRRGRVASLWLLLQREVVKGVTSGIN